MSRGEAVGLLVASFVAILSFGLTALGWYVNRRVAAWQSVLTRLAAAEATLRVVDVGGSAGNRVAIERLRQDVEALEALHRRDLIDVDRRIASSTLSQAQLAERLNAYTWGRRTDRRPRHDDDDDDDTSGRT